MRPCQRAKPAQHDRPIEFRLRRTNKNDLQRHRIRNARMNFAGFTGHIPAAAAIPSIQQFAAKFGYESGGAGGAAGAGGPFDSKFRQEGVVQFGGDKYRPPESVVVVSSAPPGAVTLAGIAPIHTVNTGVKYQSMSSASLGSYSAPAYAQEMKPEREKREFRDDELMQTMMQQTELTLSPGQLPAGQQLVVVLHEPKEAAALARAIKQEMRPDRGAPAEFISIGDVTDTSTWQTLGGGVADYLSALPLPLHHLLKYSSPGEGRKEEPTIVTLATNALPPISTITTERIPTNVANSVVVQPSTIVNNTPNNTVNTITINNNKIVINNKKKKKKIIKEKKPRPKPGEIRLTTALDGSTLYCCPECHMAYPERGLLEQHLVGHTMERRFICDICNAALKRKDHLTRHKQSHNPERPHACSVCLKAFKRKEQLTLHFVIHSGEKRHVCNECGKGFYRKDHLRKHARSHIARRVKAELEAAPRDAC